MKRILRNNIGTELDGSILRHGHQLWVTDVIQMVRILTWTIEKKHFWARMDSIFWSAKCCWWKKSIKISFFLGDCSGNTNQDKSSKKVEISVLDLGGEQQNVQFSAYLIWCTYKDIQVEMFKRW